MCLLLAGELRFALHDEPKTTDPLLMADESAEAIGYLTEESWIRVNRLTQKPEPELAHFVESIEGQHHNHSSTLRKGVVTSDTVVKTFQRLLDPALHSPIADTFKTDKGTVKVSAQGPLIVIAEFPAPTASIEIIFDQVAIGSGLGPFVVAEKKTWRFHHP